MAQVRSLALAALYRVMIVQPKIKMTPLPLIIPKIRLQVARKPVIKTTTFTATVAVTDPIAVVDLYTKRVYQS